MNVFFTALSTQKGHFSAQMFKFLDCSPRRLSAENKNKSDDAELTVTDQSEHESQDGFENMIPYLSTHPTTKKRIEVFLKN